MLANSGNRRAVVPNCAQTQGWQRSVGYDPTIPRAHYDRVADDEWSRLTRSRRGELQFLVHMDVLQRHIKADIDVPNASASCAAI